MEISTFYPLAIFTCLHIIVLLQFNHSLSTFHFSLYFINLINLYKIIAFLRRGWGCFQSFCGARQVLIDKKFKLQYGDIWLEGLSECQVWRVVISIYLVWGWFSAFWVPISIHSLVYLFGALRYLHSKHHYGCVEPWNHYFLLSVLSEITTNAIKAGSSHGLYVNLLLFDVLHPIFS